MGNLNELIHLFIYLSIFIYSKDAGKEIDKHIKNENITDMSEGGLIAKTICLKRRQVMTLFLVA